MLGGPDSEPLRAGGGEKPSRSVTVEMFDVNGDGIRDVVKALGHDRAIQQCGAPWKWQVWFGTGASYPSDHPDLLAGEMPSFLGPACWDSPHDEELKEWSKTRAYVDILDVNADGLPDYVNSQAFKGDPTQRIYYCVDPDGEDWEVSCTGNNPRVCTGEGPLIQEYCEADFPYNPEWRVWINTGNGFEDRGGVFFPKNIRTNKLERDEQDNATTNIGLVTDTFDLDGNGYPDHVQTGKAGFLKINYRHPDDRLPNTLVRVTNPLGGTTEITYKVSTKFNTTEVDGNVDPHGYHHHLPFPLWVVDTITRTDPVAGEDGKVRTRWDYRGGYFHPVERKFLGFRAVDEVQVVPDPETPGGLYDEPHTWSEFHQTLGLEGKKWLEYVFVEHGFNGLFKERRFTWNVSSSAADGGWVRFFPTLAGRLDVDPSSYPTPHWKSRYCPNCAPYPPGIFRAKRETHAHDNCGNTTAVTTFDASDSDPLTQLGDVQVKRVDLTFATAGICNTGLRVCTGPCDRVLTRTVIGGLGEQFGYDTRGNQIASTRLGEGNPTITRDFDPVGNVIEIRDAKSTRTTIEYDPVLRIHPARWVLDAGPGRKNHVVQREYDARFGTVTKHRDVAGAETLYEYDAFGRLTEAAEPGQTLGTPTRKYAYVIDDAGRSRVEARFHEPMWSGADKYRVETTFYDALARKLSRQVHRMVGGQLRTVVLDAVDRDASGHVVREYAPWVAGDSLVTTFLPSAPSLPHTTVVRDEFFRETGRNLPDGSAVRTIRKAAWVTSECDALHTHDMTKGSCVATEVDALERPVRTDLTLGLTVNPTRRERRAYHPSGQLATTTLTHATDATTVTTTYTYDALERLREKNDPSSGVWTYAYDVNDNVVEENDPTAGRTLVMTYDALDRVLTRNEPSGTPRTTTFEYDGAGVPFGTGRLHRVTRTQESGGFAYEETRTGYDGRGNVTAASQKITAAGVTRRFDAVNAYDAIGRLAGTKLPAPSEPEALIYSYSATGQVTTVQSSRNGAYVTGATYDERGRVRTLAYGNNVTETFDYHTADGKDPAGGPSRPGHADRIAHIVSRNGAGQALRQLDYQSFTRNGQIARVWDGVAGAVFEDAVYDDARRLVSWNAPGFGEKTYAYDGFGRLTTKEGTTYTYSATRPFQIATFGGEAVGYDDAGHVRTLPGQKELAYDAEGHLVSVTEGAAVTQYFSDDTGKRRVRVAPDGTKTFFFDHFDVDPAGTAVRRHIRLNGRLVVTSVTDAPGALLTAAAGRGATNPLHAVPGAVAVTLLAACLALPGRPRRGRRCSPRRVGILLATFSFAQWPRPLRAQCGPLPFADTRLYYHLDHRSSVHILTNAVGARIESTQHFAYGAVAVRTTGSGTPVADTVGDFAFTGHRKAESHGLAYFEARYYSAELAVFVSRDPAEQFPNPYSYGDGDPMNTRDPSGMESEDTTGDNEPQSYESDAQQSSESVPLYRPVPPELLGHRGYYVWRDDNAPETFKNEDGTNYYLDYGLRKFDDFQALREGASSDLQQFIDRTALELSDPPRRTTAGRSSDRDEPSDVVRCCLRHAQRCISRRRIPRPQLRGSSRGPLDRRSRRLRSWRLTGALGVQRSDTPVGE